jgi:hypothetical protein
MPDFLEKFGKDYTFQKVWEVRKTVEWHNKVGFYRFVKRLKKAMHQWKNGGL